MVTFGRMSSCNSRERFRRKSHAHHMSVFISQRNRIGGLVSFAKRRKKRHLKKRAWWERLFSDEDYEGQVEWSAEDVLGGDAGESREEGITENEEFEAWRRKAEAIIELREAQEDARSEDGRAWEDWIGARDPDWGEGGEPSNEVFDDPSKIMWEKGLVKSIKDTIDGNDDELLFEDRVFKYASTSSVC